MKVLYDIDLKNVVKFAEEYSNYIKVLPIEVLFDYIQKRPICIKGGTVAIEYEDNSLLVYLLSKNTPALFIKAKSDTDYEKTELFLSNFGNINESSTLGNQLMSVAIQLLCIVYICNNILKYNPTKNRQPKDFKVIQEKFCQSVLLKKCNLQFKYYEEIDTPFLITKDSTKVTILNNDISKTLKVIPSSLYPLSSSRNIKVFTRNNTEELPNNTVNTILSKFQFKNGYCYTNTESIVSILTNSTEFNDDVRFYSGWILKSGVNMIHHAWVVINNKHIIDPSILRGELELIKESNKISIGTKVISHEVVLNKLKELATKKNIDFNKKYGYGKILSDSDIYIGVESNAHAARNVYNSLMKKYPNHPDYTNIDKETGSNETLEYIYK